MNGFLLVDKPVGMSSYDVIRHIKRLFPVQKLKIGHAGTLDPLASGLLIILFGSATKQANRFLKLDKKYEGEITLGATSETDDGEGPIKPMIGTPKPTQRQVEKSLKQFIGMIDQTPPAHSAIKVGGQRAYTLARKGRTFMQIGLKTRKVKVYSLTLKKYSYPRLRVDVKVSSGTYIRSLARDIGQKLGTGAYLSDLYRTEIGRWTVRDAAQLDDLTVANLPNVLFDLDSSPRSE